jgi:hypothetical protein
VTAGYGVFLSLQHKMINTIFFQAKYFSMKNIDYVNVRISVRLSFIVSERLIDATSILHYELEAPTV